MTFTYETRTNKDGSTTYTKLANVGVDQVTGKRRQCASVHTRYAN